MDRHGRVRDERRGNARHIHATWIARRADIDLHLEEIWATPE